jgi:carbon-monoxide dehydrogenase small subunit
MELRQNFVIDRPRAVVWDYFADIDEVVRCMPGASLTEPVSGDRIKGKIAIKLGPIGAAFDGEGRFERDDTNYSGTIRGTGRDSKSGTRAKGEVTYVLVEESGGAATRVDVVVEFSLAGPLAQFSRGGIVNDLATRLTNDFAANLAVQLDQAGAATAPSEAAAQLDAGSLLWSVIRARIRAFFARLFGRG